MVSSFILTAPPHKSPVSIRLTSDPGEQTRHPAWRAHHIPTQCSDCACYVDGFFPAIPGFHLSMPLFYALELTPICNNRCPGCSNVFITHEDKPIRQNQNARESLDADKWRTVLDRIAPHAFNLRVTGGEPTLHPQFEEIIADINERGVPFTLFTNARWQKPQALIAFLETAPACVGLLISLHGARPEAHEAFSGVAGSFDETICNIRLATTAGLPVATSTVITHQNYDQVEAIYELTQGLGVDHAVFSRYAGFSLPLIEPIDEQLRQAVQTVDRLLQGGEKVRFGNCIPHCFVPNSSTGCLAGVAYCAIDPWGNVRPCTHDTMICGNVLDQSVEEIWHGEMMESWRNFMPEECADCVALSRCNVGCRATARQSENGVDPWMRESLHSLRHKEPTVVAMYKGARPKGCYFLHEEAFGYVLVQGTHIVSVEATAKPVLDACDGQRTLRDIDECFGVEGVNLVGSLYQYGFVDLV